MLVRYVCEFCGKVYKTREEALACEERARKLKAKFKNKQTVFDADGYAYQVIDAEVWKKNWDRLYRGKLIEGMLEVGMPIGHAFLYYLKPLDPEMKDCQYAKGEVCYTDSLATRVFCSKLKKTVGSHTKGINLLYEDAVFKEKL